MLHFNVYVGRVFSWIGNIPWKGKRFNFYLAISHATAATHALANLLCKNIPLHTTLTGFVIEIWCHRGFGKLITSLNIVNNSCSDATTDGVVLVRSCKYRWFLFYYPFLQVRNTSTLCDVVVRFYSFNLRSWVIPLQYAYSGTSITRLAGIIK